MFLVVGLGNPGPDYAFNRHNVGQMVVDVIASRLGVKYSKHKTNAMVCETRFDVSHEKMIISKPLSYMNTSGGPVANLVKFYGVEPANLIVIHDELDIPAETVRIKFGGGHAGHNGLRDIISALGSNDFIRVRVGIGRPPGSQDTADFVLKNFSSTEKKELPTTLEIAADAVEAIIKDGLSEAQMRFHS